MTDSAWVYCGARDWLYRPLVAHRLRASPEMALSEEERQVFDQAADLAATGQDASPYLTDKLVAIIDRLLAEETDRD